MHYSASLMTLRTAVMTLAIAVLAVACKKEYDSPPERVLPTGAVLTVAELRALYTGTPVHFDNDRSVYAVVTADEQNGNLYKNIYIQDHTGAIVMRLLNSGGLYQGDSIRVYLPGTVLGVYAGMMQLDSVDVDNNVVKQATLVNKTPELVTLSQITPALQGHLVRIEGVEFPVAEIGQTYADAANQATINRTLTDCSTNVIVRTSGYANFAGEQLPSGNGSFVGVVGQFNSDMQLFIRNVSEVQLFDIAARCEPLPTLCDPAASVNESFATSADASNIALECWINTPQVGTRVWRGKSLTDGIAAQASAYGSGDASDVAWLITPVVNYVPGMALTFRSQRGFGDVGHDGISVYISTDYNLANLATANWVTVPAALAISGVPDQQWVPSGSVDLGALLPTGYSGPFVIGFKYTGSDTNNQNSDIRIDDVVIQ